MIYLKKYNRYIDDDCKIYRKNKEGNLVQVKPSINNCGYEFICYGIKQVILVHRLVYEAFKGEIPEGLEIDHKDRNKHNNNPDNLRLVTRRENLLNCDFSNTHDFAKKFREHFKIKGKVSDNPNYNTEKSWYYKHDRKCSWE